MTKKDYAKDKIRYAMSKALYWAHRGDLSNDEFVDLIRESAQTAMKEVADQETPRYLQIN